jgi:hypothetical protein
MLKAPNSHHSPRRSSAKREGKSLTKNENLPIIGRNFQEKSYPPQRMSGVPIGRNFERWHKISNIHQIMKRAEKSLH